MYLHKADYGKQQPKRRDMPVKSTELGISQLSFPCNEFAISLLHNHQLSNPDFPLSVYNIQGTWGMIKKKGMIIRGDNSQ